MACNCCFNIVAQYYHQKSMSNIFALWDTNIIWEALLWSIYSLSSDFSFRNMMNYFPTTNQYWQFATSPFKISINCVIFGIIFWWGCTRECNFPLLTRFPSGAKTSAAVLMIWWWMFDNPFVLIPKRKYKPLESNTSSFWHPVEFLVMSFPGSPLDCLLDDASEFSIFYWSSRGCLGQFCLLCSASFQKPYVRWPWTKDDVLDIILHWRCQVEVLSLLLLSF